MKILHLSSEKTWRGGEQQIAYLIGELMAVGIENYVAVRDNSSFEEHCKRENIPFVTLPFRNTIDFQTALSIKTFCKHTGIDLVHVHSAKSHGIAVLAAAMGNRVPVILSRRVDFMPKNNLMTRWRYNHSSIRAILGVSDKITSIMKAFVRRREICTTVHSGVDISRFNTRPQKNVLRTEFGISADYQLIGNTSALVDHKDYETFLRTIAELHGRQIKIKAFIIGKGELEEELKMKSKGLGLDDTVFFTGFRTDLSDVLHSLDVFLMTSKTEGLGTSVLDAFACSIPVVATQAGGIPEMVHHGQSGLLAPVGDSGKLASHVASILTDNNLRERLVTGASRVLEGFSKHATAEKTLAIYRRVLKS
jgi:glycosyltransferase involved in cell wall biosynthesis